LKATSAIRAVSGQPSIVKTSRSLFAAKLEVANPIEVPSSKAFLKFK
jgi:hypothetical protein